MPYKLLFLILTISFTESCHQKKEEGGSITSKTNDQKFEIYCFCILDVPGEPANITMDNCSVAMFIPPQDLIKPKYLLTSTTDSTKIEALHNVFLKGKNSEAESGKVLDARLVFLLRKDSITADTIVFQSDSQFILNNKLKYSYPFHVIDSVKHILGIKNISCPAN